MQRARPSFSFFKKTNIIIINLRGLIQLNLTTGTPTAVRVRATVRGMLNLGGVVLEAAAQAN